MVEWTGSIILQGRKSLSNPIQVRSGWAPMSFFRSDQIIQSGSSSGTFTYDVGVKQDVQFGDARLMNGNRLPDCNYIPRVNIMIKYARFGPRIKPVFVVVIFIACLVIPCASMDSSSSVSIVANIVSSQPPVADFIGDPISGTAPLSVRFTDISTGSQTNGNGILSLMALLIILLPIRSIRIECPGSTQ